MVENRTILHFSFGVKHDTLVGSIRNRRQIMLLIQNGYVMDPKSGREDVMDILVKDKRIEKMGAGLAKDLSEQELAECQIIDA